MRKGLGKVRVLLRRLELSRFVTNESKCLRGSPRSGFFYRCDMTHAHHFTTPSTLYHTILVLNIQDYASIIDHEASIEAR